MEKDIDKKSDGVSSNHKRGRKGRKSIGHKDLTEVKEEEIGSSCHDNTLFITSSLLAAVILSLLSLLPVDSSALS
jgi:hypothetical protein